MAVPGRPTAPYVENVTHSNATVVSSTPSNGGKTITEYQIGWGTSSVTNTQAARSGTQEATVGGLQAETYYNFYTRARNADGWGEWSPATRRKTLKAPQPPSAPKAPSVELISATTVGVYMTDPANNGYPITDRQIGWNAEAQSVPHPDNTKAIGTSKSGSFSGFSTDRTYYFYARARNQAGWGPWSPYATLYIPVPTRPPGPPSQPRLTVMSPTEVKVEFDAPSDDGGASIFSYQIGWSTTSGTPSNTKTGDSGTVITGLDPAKTYFFRVRARNTNGYGSWSIAASTNSSPYVYITMGTEIRAAIPFVKVNGVWKVAQPMVRERGEWEVSG